jgi:hypothetical protein
MSIATAELCDSCAAPAKFTILITSSGGTLTFCGHHFTKNETALKRVGEVFEYGKEPEAKVGSYATPSVPEDVSAEFNPGDLI